MQKKPPQNWVRQGLLNDDLDRLRDIFANFDLNNSGTINGCTLFQAFNALNMQKRSPQVFDIIKKIAGLDREIDVEEFINIIGGVTGNTMTEEGGEVVFNRMCTRKFIWKEEDKQLPERLLPKRGNEDEDDYDSEEERDVMPMTDTVHQGFKLPMRMAELYQYELDPETGEPLFSMDTLGVICDDLDKKLTIPEIETIFFGATESENFLTKEHFMTLYREKVLNMGEEKNGGSSKKGRRGR